MRIGSPCPTSRKLTCRLLSGMVAAVNDTSIAATISGGITHFLGNLETELAALGIRSANFCLWLLSQIAAARAK